MTRSAGIRWSESTRPAHGSLFDDDDVRRVMAESFLRDLPEREQQALRLSARPMAIPAGKLIYDPQISIIIEGTLRAFVDDGAGRHLTVSSMRRPQSLGIAISAGQEFPVAFQAVTASRVVRLRLTQIDELRHRGPQVGWRANPRPSPWQKMAIDRARLPYLRICKLMQRNRGLRMTTKNRY